MAVVCSAPGKVYLFGEHAVVYGEPAIACAVNIRTKVRVEKAAEVKIRSVLGRTGMDFEVHPYVSGALAAVQKLADGNRGGRRPESSETGCQDFGGVCVDVESDIPVGAGLGSSAAVTIAVLEALNLEFGLGLSREEVARMGHAVELEVQSAASPTDTIVSTMGGAVFIPSGERLNPPDCGIVIGNTNSFSRSDRFKTARLVGGVRELQEAYPGVVSHIFSAIGGLALEGRRLLENGDYPELGRLMNINHGLLEALGVSTRELSRLVYAARENGAWGAKLTGAGGGGCMVAITDQPEKVAQAIERAGGMAFITSVSQVGVEVC